MGLLDLKVTCAVVFLLLVCTGCMARLSSTFYDSTCPNALSTVSTSIQSAVSREHRMAASHFHDCFVPVGGPTWTVNLGRRDSTTASACQAQRGLPSSTSPLQTLIHQFATKGLSTRDLVALFGSHTIGQARCVTFHDRVNSNASDIDASFASTRRRRCPVDVTKENATLAALDLVTPNQLDNNYFKNLLRKKGLLASNQILFSGGSTDSIAKAIQNLAPTSQRLWLRWEILGPPTLVVLDR